MSKADKYDLATKWTGWQEYGFTKTIPDHGMRAFYQALFVCANGDGVVSPAERDWILGSAAAFGVTDALLDELRTYDPNGKNVKDVLSQDPHEIKHSRRNLIMEAIRACASDGEYHADEKAVVHSMAAQLGVEEKVVAKLESLYKESAELRQRIIDTVFAEGNPY